MPGRGRGRGKVRAPPVVEKRRPTTTTDATPSIPSSSNVKSPLPARYNFTPPPPQLHTKKRKQPPQQNLSPPQASPSTMNVRDYPPPTQLFQTSLTRQPLTSHSQPLTTPLQGSQPPPETSRRHSFSNNDPVVSPRRSVPSPPLQNSSGHSNHFFNSVDNDEASQDSDDEVIDDTAQFDPDLEDSRLEALNALLSVPNRHMIRGITTLSPIFPQPAKTTW